MKGKKECVELREKNGSILFPSKNVQVWNSFSLRKEKEKVVEQVGYLRYFTKGRKGIPQSLGFDLWTQISHEDVVMFWKIKQKTRQNIRLLFASYHKTS